MPLFPYAFARPFLFSFDPEAAHELILSALERLQRTPLICAVAQRCVDDPCTVAGMRFRNRIGLAAGLDKNGRCIDGLGAMGFGFIEAGTVTPRAQPGNPRPRMFRLPQADALINRLGFNNEGLDAVVGHVRRARFREQGGILGLNIGKNADTPIERAVDDYLACLEGVYPHADYVSVNVSSPNTRQLRTLQGDAALSALLSALQERAQQLAKQHGRKAALFVKISPDLDEPQVHAVADVVKQAGIDGVIATNTTIARSAVQHLPHGREDGGLSGAPVFEASNRVIAQLRSALGPGVAIIGVGGVTTGAQAVEKITAGADLVQIYTGLIYRGPALVAEAASALARSR